MMANDDPKVTNDESGKLPEYILSDANLMLLAEKLKSDCNWALSSHCSLNTVGKNGILAPSVQALLAIEDERRKRRKEQEKTDNRRPVRLVPRQPG